MKYLLISFIALSFMSCRSTADATNSTESSATNATNTTTEQASTTTDSSTDANTEKTIFASIQKTACYGRCPVYTMEIYSDGSVHLNGINFIDKIGNYTSSITPEQKQEFIAVAKEIDYMNLEDKYDGPVTDLPATITSITLDGVTKSVYRRVDYPERILAFEKLFTSLLDTLEWTKVEEEAQD